MNVSIYSRRAVCELIADGFPENTAVISFYSRDTNGRGDHTPVDYAGKPARLYYVCAPDADIDALQYFGLNIDTYMADADRLAAFIKQAVNDGLDIICQCDYGQSRSAACCAAILEYYEHTGISVFADYRYYPNQLVFNKVLDAIRSVSVE